LPLDGVRIALRRFYRPFKLFVVDTVERGASFVKNLAGALVHRGYHVIDVIICTAPDCNGAHVVISELPLVGLSRRESVAAWSCHLG
jgi:hypothetical protein